MFLLSVADVFFGIVGVLVCLIVLAGKNEDVRIVESFDHQAICEGSDIVSFRLRPEAAVALTADKWLEGLPEELFSVRWAVRPETDDLSCYLIAQQIATDHNRKLESRGATQAVLSVEFWSHAAKSGAP